MDDREERQKDALNTMKKMLISTRAKQLAVICFAHNLPIDSITIAAMRLLAYQLAHLHKAIKSKEFDPDNMSAENIEQMVTQLLDTTFLELDFILADDK